MKKWKHCKVSVLSICMAGLVFAVGLSSCRIAQKPAAGPIVEVKRDVERVDPYMGDWEGIYKSPEGEEEPIAAQVIALGEGRYRVNMLSEFDKRIKPIVVMDGLPAGTTEAVLYIGQSESPSGMVKCYGAMEKDKFSGSFQGTRRGSFAMHRVFRPSPTLGLAPPPDAVVLFDGKNLNAWQGVDAGPAKWKVAGGSMEVAPGTGSIISKKKVDDFKLHLEFRTPFMPDKRGQGRGNSGVYCQERYEVQILDSYGLEGHDNECGGIYNVGAPAVNMCAPPMQWQTYDITFHAARFNDGGEKTQNALLTVVHNGVIIHNEIEIPGPTGGARGKDESKAGGICLQDHGNKVQYRNIWLVEL